MARRASAKSDAQESPKPQATRRRLTDADREKIRELSLEGKTNLEISFEIPTSLATVSKVLNGGGTTRRARREQPDASTETVTPTQRRLIQLAVATVMDQPVLDSEKLELREMIEARIAEARQAAEEHALATL